MIRKKLIEGKKEKKIAEKWGSLLLHLKKWECIYKVHDRNKIL